jgi:hypothetical protein
MGPSFLPLLSFKVWGGSQNVKYSVFTIPAEVWSVSFSLFIIKNRLQKTDSGLYRNQAVSSSRYNISSHNPLDLAPAQVLSGCRGISGPVPQPLLIRRQLKLNHY